MEHTKEPWKVVNGVDVQSGPQGALAYVSTAGARGRTLEEAEANAQRVAACVNACAGIPTRSLLLLAPGDLLRLAQSVNSRGAVARSDVIAGAGTLEDLVRACEDAAAYLEANLDTPLPGDAAGCLRRLRSVIAKAEGK